MKKAMIFLALLSIAVSAQNAFTDKRDGKKYRTVKIGEQAWMAQNLNYKTKGSACYKGNVANCQKYGMLYDWETAVKACPAGWHLPSDTEWQILVNFTGDAEFAGRDLKAKNGWNEKSNGTDKYAFSALPGGSAGQSVAFGNIGCDGGCWWSSTAAESEGMDDAAYGRQMNYDHSDDGTDTNSNSVDRYYDAKQVMFSVRCVKD
jgi:uncharacterized protein (TIGR02145 family)